MNCIRHRVQTIAISIFFIQDNYNDNSEVILSREYDPALNMGHNVPNSIPNSEQGMSRDCFEEYLCANTGKPISLCGCHNPNMGYNAEMKNRDGRLLQTVCLPESGSKYARFLYRTTGGLLKGGALISFLFFPTRILEPSTLHLVLDIRYVSSIRHLSTMWVITKVVLTLLLCVMLRSC